MKYFVIFLKVLLVIATGVCALVFNILGCVSLIATGQAEEIEIMPIVIYWLIFSIVCFLPPVFLAMFKKYVIGGIFGGVGLICVIVLNSILNSVASGLYLQLVLISAISILLAIFGNWDKITDSFDERERRKREKAPSILGGMTEEAEPVRKKGKKTAKAK